MTYTYNALDWQKSCFFGVYSFVDVVTPEFDGTAENVYLWRDGVLIQVMPILDTGIPSTGSFTLGEAIYFDSGLANGTYFYEVFDQDGLSLGSKTQVINCEINDYTIDVTTGCADDGGYVTFDVTYVGASPVTVTLHEDDGFGSVVDSINLPPSPQSVSVTGLADGTYIFYLESSTGLIIYSGSYEVSCGAGTGIFTDSKLYIPFKKWAYPRDGSLVHHATNWYRIERWSREIRCTGRSTGVDWELLPLLIPYKGTCTPEQSENNYNVFERWARQICDPIHIPFKKWGFENNLQGNPIHEEENLTVIEQWSRGIGSCCTGGGTSS